MNQNNSQPLQSRETDMSQIKQKAIHGALSLTARRAAIYVIRSIVIAVVLPRYLEPGIIGTFNLANTIISFFGFFSDVGLAAALIQKKEIDEDDVHTTFFVQQVLVIALSIIIFLFAPHIASFARLATGGDVLIRVLAIAFFLTSLKSIPSVLAERNLNFTPMAITDITEAAIFCLLVLPLAISGFDIYAYAAAQLAASIVGVVLIYNLSPWQIKFRYKAEALHGMLAFGLPYQTNQFLALLKDRLVPIVVVRMITITQMGYVTQAQAWAFIPLEIMNIISRVTFPAYSRLQHDREVLARAVERSLYVMGLFLYPAIAGLLALLPILISIVGTNKWGPAIPLVYLFSFSTFWASISSTYTNVFNAVGQVKLTLKLMVMWTTLEWALTPVLVWQFGYVGVGIAAAIISFSSIVTIIVMSQIAKIDLLGSVGKPIAASIGMGVVLFILARYMLTSKIMLIPLIIIGILLYFSIMYAIDKKRLLKEAKEVFRAIR